jgi:hypothetical protein
MPRGGIYMPLRLLVLHRLIRAVMVIVVLAYALISPNVVSSGGVGLGPEVRLEVSGLGTTISLLTELTTTTRLFLARKSTSLQSPFPNSIY